MHRLADVLVLQSGVVSRRQCLARGVGKHDLARLARQRLLVPIHPGIYVDHTGEPTWLQRAWAGVLAAWPAALADQTALRACEGPGRRIQHDDSVHVGVDRHRHLRAPDGVVLHRIDGFEGRVLWNLGPPRLRYEDAALRVAAAAATDFEALGLLATVIQSRRTTAARILSSAQDRPHLARRAWITSVLEDVAAGTCSVLEHGYLARVERAHGLPTGRRQQPAGSMGSTVLRDVEYTTGLVVELDGRLFHDSALRRDADLDRDLDAAVDGHRTVRLSWGQVFDRPCRTAERVGTLLVREGWAGTPGRCGSECRLETSRLVGRTR